MTTRTPLIAALVTDEEFVEGGAEFWVVLDARDGTYLAAWVDEDGALKTATRKTASSALKLASSKWGA
jgi:hypothetical protein